jgi:Protein of unknown function (DUF3168)
MKSALWPLQISIFQRLKNDTALQARANVYDSVPEGATFPYCTVGEDTVVPNDSKTYEGEEITHTLHVWSTYNGKKEVKEIMSSVLDSLTREPLIVSGFFVEFSRLDLMQVFETDGTPLKHGVIRMRFRIIQ